MPASPTVRTGALPLVASSLLFGAMAVVTKLAAARVPGPEVALLRFLVGLAGTAVYALAVRPLRPVNLPALALRGFFGGSAVLGFFVAIWKLPVGIATLLNYTAPIFTALFAAVFLGERVGGRTAAALVLTTVGVTVVVHAHHAPGAAGAPGVATPFDPWLLVGVASAVLSGAAVTAIRWSRRTDGSWEVFGAFSVIGALVCAVPSWLTWVRPDALAWALMVAVGLLSLGAQILFVHALRYTRAATAGVISQLVPVTAMALGVLWLGEGVSWMSLLGAAVTLAGVAWGALPAR